MEKTKKILTVVKVVGGIVISIGIGAVATNLIRATTPKNVKKITKICIEVGSFFASGLAAAKASEKFDCTIDTIMGVVTKFIGNNDESKKKIVETET